MASPLGTILLISSAFPPSTEARAARWEAFVPYLISGGWRLSVLSEEPPAGSPTDHGRVTSLGLDVSLRLVRRRPPAWRESALSAVSRFRRTRQHPQAASPAFFTEVRDSSIASALCQLHPRELFRAAVMASEARQWVRDLVAYSEKYDFVKHAVMVISSGPPHDAHVAAAVIATRRGVPQVVDLRDPWTGNTGEIDMAKFLLRGPIGSHAERRVLASAAAIIVNTPSAAATLLGRHSETAGRVHVVLKRERLRGKAGTRPCARRKLHCGAYRNALSGPRSSAISSRGGYRPRTQWSGCGASARRLHGSSRLHRRTPSV